MLTEIAEIVGLFFIGTTFMLIIVLGGWYLCYHLWLKDIDFIQKQYRKRILREKFEEHKYSDLYKYFEQQSNKESNMNQNSVPTSPTQSQSM